MRLASALPITTKKAKPGRPFHMNRVFVVNLSCTGFDSFSLGTFNAIKINYKKYKVHQIHSKT